MRMWWISLVVACGLAVGCSSQPQGPAGTSTGGATPGGTAVVQSPATPASPVATAVPVAKLDKEMEAAFRALDKFKPDEDFRFEKEYDAVKKSADKRAAKKDREFLENVFVLAEHGGKKNDQRAASELLCYVVSEYKSGDWADCEIFRARALTAVTSSRNKVYRDGAWGFLLYMYQPEKNTVEVIKGFKASTDPEIRFDIIDKVGDSTEGAFIKGNEAALVELATPLASDKAETPRMRAAAIILLGAAGKKDPKVKTLLEGLKSDPDEQVQKATTKALEKLGK